MVNPAYILALLGVTIATISDYKTRRVPNWLTVSMLLSGLGLAIIQNGFAGFWSALAGGLVGLAIFLFPFAMGWLGGGDVKLFMGVGALLGIQAIIWVALYSAVAGGVGALFLVIFRLLQNGQLLNQARLSCTALRVWLTSKPWFFRQRPLRQHQVLPSTQAALREKFPYAFAIGIGTLLVVWQGYPPLW